MATTKQNAPVGMDEERRNRLLEIKEACEKALEHGEKLAECMLDVKEELEDTKGQLEVINRLLATFYPQKKVTNKRKGNV